MTTEETELAETLVDDAERKLSARISNLPAQIMAGTIDVIDVISVESHMVARVVRNPDGYRQESEDGYGYTLDTRAAAGFLTVLSDEWAQLGVRDGAFSIAPYLETPPVMPINLWRSW